MTPRLCVALILCVFACLAPRQAESQAAIPFPPGSYAIHPAANIGSCMDLSGGKAANGTAIQSWRCNGTVAQQWSLVPVSTDSGEGFQLTSAATGSCLDITGPSSLNGAQIHQWQCLGASQLSQVWRPVQFGTRFQFVSLLSGKCLDLTGGSFFDGNQLQQWTCAGESNSTQLWSMEIQSLEGALPNLLPPGSYSIRPVADANVCVDLSGAGRANGTVIQTYGCNNTDAQQWSLVPVVTGFGKGFQLVSAATNACLDIVGPSSINGAQIHQWQCLGASQLSQIWLPVQIGTHFEFVSLLDGKCLDLSNGSLDNGNQLQQWTCSGGSNPNQLWSIHTGGATTLLRASVGTQKTWVSVEASPAQISAGQSMVLVGNISSDGGVPSGPLNFYLNDTYVGSSALDSSGTARLPLVKLPSGIYDVLAQFPGNSTYSGAASASTRLSVTIASSNPQAFAADTFVDSIGVQTHISYIGTEYATAWPRVLAKLHDLGIRHIRDGYVSDADLLAKHQQLAAAGIHATIGAPLGLSSISGPLLTLSAADLEALEAPNECDNNSNCGSNATEGISNVVSYLPKLENLGRALGVPVIGPSFVNPDSYRAAGDLRPFITYNNLHVYFGGRNPGSAGWGAGDAQGNAYGSIPYWLDASNADAPQVVPIITETGYISFPQTSQAWTIPESVEALYKPRLLLLSFMQGVKRTFLYELIDEQTEPGYGLLHADLSEKPAFAAVKSLVALLSDPGPPFEPGQLNYVVTGADDTVKSLLLQKRDGTYWLALWSEQSCYDPSNNVSVRVPEQIVTLTLADGREVKNVLRFDTSGNANPAPVTNRGNAFELHLSDALTLVEIR